MSHLERALLPADVSWIGSRKLQSRASSVHSIDYGRSIAVVGMAGRFPNAQNVDELWKVLINGQDLHQMVSSFTEEIFESRA